MNNRIWNRAKRLRISLLIFTMIVWGTWGQTAQIKASNVDNRELQILQSAQWTEEPYRAEICMEITGLLSYREKYTGQGDKTDVSAVPEERPSEDIIGDVTEEPAESAQAAEEGWEEERESFGEEIQEAYDEGQVALGKESQEIYGEEDVQKVWGGEQQETFDREQLEIYDEEIQEAQALKGSDFSQEYEEIPESGTEKPVPQLFIENYISEFFQPIGETLPENSWIEEVNAADQKGDTITLCKIVYPVKTAEITKDSLRLTFQAVLKEEYRYPAVNTRYPVSQDEPLNKDCAGTGMHLLEAQGMESIILAQAESPFLEVQGGRVDFDLKLKAQSGEIKAGNTCVYEFQVTNTGDMELKNIQIRSDFEKEQAGTDDTKAVWEAGQGISVQGKEALILELGQGQRMSLFMTVQLNEGDSGQLVHKISVQAPCPKKEGEIITKEVREAVKILPLTADFTVEKTADRTQAYPGDTIHYQICIRNTGERTLHSVLSTERFLGANVQARFIPKEGVTLNSAGTQALIEKIAPGEAFAIQASVTLPQYFTAQELVNQVTVTSKETGTKNYESQSKINVISPSVTDTPNSYSGYQVEYQSGNLGKSAYSAGSQPKTGDDTSVGLFIMLLSLAILSVTGVFWKVKGKSKD